MPFNCFRKLLYRFRPAEYPVKTPQIPDGMIVYAIGDIHGELRLLRRLLDQVADHCSKTPDLTPHLVFLGDYIDRGADSRGVLEYLASCSSWTGFRVHTLRGNHEQAMLDFLDDPVAGASWLDYGGIEALASYGVRASVGTSDPKKCCFVRDELRRILPNSHLAFLTGLPPSLVLGDYAFVHAGIRPGRPLAAQRNDDLLWIRQPFLSSTRRHEKIIVHGHTVVETPEVLANRIGIDTGAYASGTLTALALYGTNQEILQSQGEAGI